MTDKLTGRINQMDFDYHKHAGRHETLLFRRGGEHVKVEMSHPAGDKLEESDEYSDGDTVHSKSRTSSSQQQTIWDKPEHTYPPTIDGLFATPGAKTDVATALGVTAMHSMRKFGRVPEVSQDLSKHSLPLVQRYHALLNESGTPHSYAPSVPRNNWSKVEGANAALRGSDAWDNLSHMNPQGGPKNISDEHIAEGSRVVRSLFAGRHLNRQQFTQPELPL